MPPDLLLQSTLGKEIFPERSGLTDADPHGDLMARPWLLLSNWCSTHCSPTLGPDGPDNQHTAGSMLRSLLSLPHCVKWIFSTHSCNCMRVKAPEWPSPITPSPCSGLCTSRSCLLLCNDACQFVSQRV